MGILYPCDIREKPSLYIREIILKILVHFPTTCFMLNQVYTYGYHTWHPRSSHLHTNRQRRAPAKLWIIFGKGPTAHVHGGHSFIMIQASADLGIW